MTKTVAVVGASRDRRKFGNKALRAFVHQGHHVIPINPHETLVEGLPAYPSVLAVPDPIDMVTMYVPARIGEQVIGQIAEKGVKEVWINPGAESAELVYRARRLGIHPILACSIVAIGESPSDY